MVDLKKLLTKLMSIIPNTVHGADGDKRQAVTVTVGNVFTAPYTGWLISYFTTNQGASPAPYVELRSYNANGAYVGTVNAAWGITTSGAGLAVSGPVTKGCKYALLANRCTLTSTYVYIGGGYFLNAVFSMLSAIERWWEHGRFEGFTDQDGNVDALQGVHRLWHSCRYIYLHIIQYVHDTVRWNRANCMHIQGKLLHHGDAKRWNGTRARFCTIIKPFGQRGHISTSIQRNEGVRHKVIVLQLRLLLPVHDLIPERGCYGW